MKKLSKIYIGALLDFLGCFYKHRGKYQHFKIRTNDLKQKKVLDDMVKVFKTEGIDVGVYALKTHYLYQIASKKSIDNLKKFMNKYCLFRRVK